MPDDKFLSAPIDAAGYIDLGKGDILERTRRALAGVSPTPWEFDDTNGGPHVEHCDPAHLDSFWICEKQIIPYEDGTVDPEWAPQVERNLQFIAAAPTLVRDLMAEVEVRGQCLDGMRAEIETLRAEVERLRGGRDGD